jgi:hypothetical protein
VGRRLDRKVREEQVRRLDPIGVMQRQHRPILGEQGHGRQARAGLRVLEIFDYGRQGVADDGRRLVIDLQFAALGARENRLRFLGHDPDGRDVGDLQGAMRLMQVEPGGLQVPGGAGLGIDVRGQRRPRAGQGLADFGQAPRQRDDIDSVHGHSRTLLLRPRGSAPRSS